jgi:chitobiase/beta-hexosaminidase-like protein/S-layer family protein
MANQRTHLTAILVLLVSSLFGCRTTPPKIAIPTGNYICPQIVSLTDSAPHVSIYYTMGGATPQPSSPKYVEPLTVKNTDIVKAIAVAPNRKPSKVVTARYTCTKFWGVRRDFAVLQQTSFQLPPPQQTVDYPDLPSTDANYAAIQAAAPFMNLQILCQGCMLSKNFGPDLQVSRAGYTISVIRILVSRNQLQLVNIVETNKILVGVADVNDIPAAARAYFATAIKYGIVSVNSDKKILPQSGFTRQELASQVERLGKQFGVPGTLQ